MSKKKSVGILGAGAFGTALALVYRDKFDVTLFSFFDAHVKTMATTRINEFLNDYIIPDNIKIDSTTNAKSQKYDYLFWCFPLKPTPGILEKLIPQIDTTDIIICSKGLLYDSSFIYDLFCQKLPSSDVAYLAGANFATELADGKISDADIASSDIKVANRFAKELTTDSFRLNPIDDIVGAQVAGSVKNVAAIACGIAYGLNLGENAHATLVALALAEMAKLGLSLGAQKETFYGFCGLGDLVLTASNATSRNTSLGIEIVKGTPIQEILKNSTCEGYDTLPQIISLAKQNNVKLPICETVHKILFQNQSPSIITNVFK